MKPLRVLIVVAAIFFILVLVPGVQAAAPVANFTATPTSGSAPLNVQFMDSSTNTPTSWNWSFDDGSSSTLKNPTHKFTSPGTYTVALNATNSAGSNTFTWTNYITVSPGGESYEFVTKWGSDNHADGQINWAWDVAVDSSGNVYVADTYNNRIQKFSSDGTFITKWGAYGSGDGEFQRPQGVATDSSGNVYVADSNNNRIQKFSSTGSFLAKWGSQGSGDGQFNSPTRVAVDSSGNVYVADAYNNRIQKFNSTGTFLAKWGTLGIGDGQFNSPKRVAVDSSGNVYVADANNNRIQKFNSTGTFLAKWGTAGIGDGQFQYPLGVAVDSLGNVYVIDRDNNRVQKFSSAGTFLAKWGSRGLSDGEFRSPLGVAVDSSGNVYVADTYNNRIQKFNSTGTFITKWGGYTDDGKFNAPLGVTIDSSGNVYVADTFNDRIQKFSSTGIFLAKWGTYGIGDGQFNSPTRVAVDSSGNFYVAEANNHRIQRFNSTGTFLAKWGTHGSGDGQFHNPVGVAVDSSGNVYVADSVNNRIQKFNSTGSFLAKWGSQGSGDGQFQYPDGVIVDLSGNVYVADTDNNRIQKFNSTGSFLAKWGSQGSGDGQFQYPRGVATDSSGNVYVADSNNNRIQKFSSTGSFLAKWGEWGSGDGQFGDTRDVAVDSSGNVYVADMGNFRIQKFSPSSAIPPVANFTATSPTSGTAPLSVSFNDLSSNNPTGWAWFFGDENFTAPWTLVNASAGWSARVGHSSVVMPDGSIVLMGGDDGNIKNDVWRSMDNGATWTQVNTSAGWTGRGGHSTVVMPDGSIVLMGGVGYYGSTPSNDVWRSTDSGATWTQVNASAGWSGRYGHSSVVMQDGSIVLMGGRYNQLMSDVWRSTNNGTTWSLMNASPGWSARYGHSSVVMPDDSIVLIGGSSGPGNDMNDVWRSTDNGETWTQVNPSTGGWGRNTPSSVVMPDGSIVLMGGYSHTLGGTNDVWRSIDNGTTWTQVDASSEWSTREQQRVVVMPDGSIVLMGGSSGGYKNDVWRFVPTGSSAQNPSHTYTTSGKFNVTLQVYNTGGYNSTRKTGYITVTGSSALVANFTTNITSGTAPLTVRFTDISTGSPMPTIFNMSFGDGAWMNTTGPWVHTYTHEGTYFPVIYASNGISNASGTNATISVNVTPNLNPDLAKAYNTVLNNATILNGTATGKSVFASPVLPAGSTVQTWGEKPAIVLPTAGRIIFIDDYPGANWEHPCRYVHVDNVTGVTTVYEAWSPPTNTALDQIAGVVPAPGGDANSVTSVSPNPGGGLGALNLTAACTGPDCSHNYALLISGGFNTSQNHLRYWNDISFMYQTLNQTYGYPASHITVLMSDGTSTANDRHNATLANGTIKTDTSPVNLDGNYTSSDVNGDAKKATVIATFRTLNSTLTTADNLFIFTTSHGGWDTVKNSNNSILYLWNQEYINDTEFVASLPKNAGNITMVMEQCYSGGFVDNFIDKYTGVSQGRVIITAANGSEPSWGNGFSNTWTSGVARIDEQRNLNLNADTSPADGKISMWEAYNYSLKYDPSANPTLPYHEHPQYSAKNPTTAGTTRFLSTCPGSTARTIKVTKPATAETWNIGTQRLITWTYTGLSSTENVNISLWKGTVRQQYIAQLPAKTGSYIWTVPTLTTGTDYWVNISSVTIPVVANRSPTYALSAAGMIGTVKVNTTPVQGANITIDGVLNRATTNATISLTPGDHKISVTKNHTYGAWSWVTVRSGSTLPVNFVLEEVGANDVPPYGTIVIASSIPGAGVFIDGENTGLVTPASTEILNGTHNVSVTSYGYVPPPTQSVYVPPHETVTMEFTFTVVSNVAPLVDAGPDATSNNGTAFASSGFFTDSGAGPWTATVNYGDGTGSQPLTLSGKEFWLSHVYAGTGIFTITVTVTDQNNKIGSDTVTVTVKPLSSDIGNITKIGVFRPSKNQFYLDINGNGVWNGGVTDRSYTFGITGDIPVSGDWNGNGKTEIGVFRPSTHMFYLDYNGNGVWNGAVTDRSYNFGITGDFPVSGDWNNDGKTEVGVFRNSTHLFYLDYNGNGVWNGIVTDQQYNFGITGDLPVSGDWNKDGRTEIGVFRNATHLFYVDYNGNGAWNGGVTDRQYNFGLSGDLPVSGDWNNDGISEIGVFRPSTHTYYLDSNGNGVWNGALAEKAHNFGLTGDLPVYGKWA